MGYAFYRQLDISIFAARLAMIPSIENGSLETWKPCFLPHSLASSTMKPHVIGLYFSSTRRRLTRGQ